MTPQDQIKFLIEEVDKIDTSIKDKEKQIELLKQAIKVDKKRLKATEEGLAFYHSQIEEG